MKNVIILGTNPVLERALTAVGYAVIYHGNPNDIDSMRSIVESSSHVYVCDDSEITGQLVTLACKLRKKVCNEPKSLWQPEIVTLCGSRKFIDIIYTEAARLRKRGYIVFIPQIFDMGVDEWVHNDNDETPLLAKLDIIHQKKILMADWVYVIDVGGYIGSDTQQEIDFAIAHNKPVVHYA